ncbi:MAG: PfkB family carbohydrate kinase [Solirubrobacterales bacterium]
MTVVCLGEAIVDLVCERELDRPVDADRFRPLRGGALANTAVAASRSGGDAALLGGVGDDGWGEWLRAGLAAEGVHVGWLATVPAQPTPIALVTFDRSRESVFSVYGESIGPTMAAAERFLGEAMDEASALVFGSNTLVGEPERRITLRARREALDRGVPVLFDPNLRPNRWREMGPAVEFCRELCDGALVVRANRGEAELLTGETDPAAAALGLCALGARLGVVTLGAEGAVMRGASAGEVASPPVEVVAPLGAGDAFMGALAAGLAELDWDGGRAAEALPGAAAAGAAACGRWGAQ